jgi:hypothetical protein
MSTLDQFKTQTPQSVLYSLQERVHKAQELQNKIESNSLLDVEDRERLIEFIASMTAFFGYAYSTLERVSYSRLDETELVRSDHLVSLRDAVESFFRIAEERERFYQSEGEKLRTALDKWNQSARHPYI